MPDFLGRPQLPNSLAQSLVQLAAQQEDPIATAFKTVGHLADQYAERANQVELLKKKAEFEDLSKQKEYAHQKELERMRLGGEENKSQRAFLTDLVKAGMFSPAEMNFDQKAVSQLQGKGKSFTGPVAERTPAPKGSIETEKLPPGSLPFGTRGNISKPTEKKYQPTSGAAIDPKIMAEARRVFLENPENVMLPVPEQLVGIQAIYDGMMDVLHGKTVPTPKTKEASVPKEGVLDKISHGVADLYKSVTGGQPAAGTDLKAQIAAEKARRKAQADQKSGKK